MAKAAVLPVPVFDRTMTSLPSRIGRKVADCTGVGFSYPRSAMARRTASERPDLVEGGL